jgi:hypothetical protein
VIGSSVGSVGGCHLIYGAYRINDPTGYTPGEGKINVNFNTSDNSIVIMHVGAIKRLCFHNPDIPALSPIP